MEYMIVLVKNEKDEAYKAWLQEVEKQYWKVHGTMSGLLMKVDEKGIKSMYDEGLTPHQALSENTVYD